jgi:hypothetical protein
MSLESCLTDNTKKVLYDVSFKNVNATTINNLPPGTSSTIDVGTEDDMVVCYPVFVHDTSAAENAYIDKNSPLNYVSQLGQLGAAIFSASANVGSGTVMISNGATVITITVASAGAAYPIVLPATQGANGTTLRNDGAGNLSWAI